MRQTEHYSLNLWDLSDRIKMEDFNSDNTKLDAALNALAVLSEKPVVKKLVDYGLGGPSLGSGMPIFGTMEPAWDDYSFVVAYGGVINPVSGGTPYASLQAHGDHHLEPAGSKFHFTSGDFMYLLLPFHDGTRYLEGFFLCSGQFRHFELDIPYNQINYFGAGADTSSGNYAESTITTLRSFGIR